MHERALLNDIVRKLEEIAGQERCERIVRVRVRLGILSHFTPEHFCEHFVDATRGTRAEGAVVDAWVDPSTSGPAAQGVVLELVEVEAAPEQATVRT
jgi:hydrogenase nickel incorporation protein HypA/HybF